jgi:hypothetical protein
MKAAEIMMECPNCKTPMAAGKVQLRQTWPSLFLNGFSINHLFFQSSGVREWKKILQFFLQYKSHFCSPCDILVIHTGSGKQSTDTIGT